VRCLISPRHSDLEIWLRIEAALGTKLTEYGLEKDEVMVFKPRVEEAQRVAKNEMKQLIEDRGKKGSVLKGGGKGRKRGAPGSSRDNMDAEEG
jgi:ATP-dependent RNA helicase DDX47/RRP3